MWGVCQAKKDTNANFINKSSKIMKIGLLSYQSACNFGAFLQLLSTVEYLKKQGDEPRVINWIPLDLDVYYKERSPLESNMYESLREQYYPRTRLCRTSHDIAEVIKEEGIQGVIIGSDAVAQYHPFLSRIVFPTKHILKVVPVASHRTYPSPFWGDFAQYLDPSFPIVMLSASSQDSSYGLIHGKVRKQMRDTVEHFRYISVRDDWTQKMISHITNGEIVPQVTPDPVFAINYNCINFFPSKKEVCQKFGLPENYFLLSFKKENSSVSAGWLAEFKDLAQKENVTCVSLPYAESESLGGADVEIPRPLSPLDWFSLIKYSRGYIGNNMHPIIVSLHNATPFFTFDNYGIVKLRGFYASNKSSKIYHIVKLAGFLSNYVYAIGKSYKEPEPQYVLKVILNFDKEKCSHFAEGYYKRYLDMMTSVNNALKAV